jgi:Tol biopolymer transport system component
MHRWLGLVFVVATLLPQATSAQYFGQNRVQYRDFDFSIVRTEHFDVYYYSDVRVASLDAARMAERAYGRFSRLLNHQYRERQPIILFGSHSEFQQNNLTDISEGVQGVTDPFRHRVMLPFTGSYRDFDHVLQHEIVHQFQFDVFARGQVGAGLSRLMAVQPPLWFMEGMAEYLSVGPVDAQTAMWLRDAALEGKLPTIERLTNDPRIFPYRFGHALMSFIGERWGDEVIAELLHGVAASGLAVGFRRALGTSLEELSNEWHDAVQRKYLPQIRELDKARHFSRAVLTRRRSKGALHVSPVLSPDGEDIAYFSEGGSFFIDLYLADATTGRIKERLAKSAFSADFESLRFLNSAGAWSADGRFFAFPAKHGGRDDLIIFDVSRGRVHRRIDFELTGIGNPSWSPDGTQLVFTGFSGGFSNLFLVNADGTGLRQLTNDRYAAFHPAWSPDGRTIAFVTDRGPQTDLTQLRTGSMALALLHLDSHTTELLSGMEGQNINPQWSPDGKSLAFVSDRTGIANVFLFELEENALYQLTNVFTGVSGITPISPAISWARQADRLAFAYYEAGEYNVYAVDNPRSLKGERYPTHAAPLVASADPELPPLEGSWGLFPVSDTTLWNGRQGAGSFYRARQGFRSSAADPKPFVAKAKPISVKALLDSAALALPDTSDFQFQPYSPTLRVDYAVQPSIGFQRDNFGSGVYGGTAISLSDILGNRRVVLGAQINGRIEEAQVLAAFANLAHRTTWSVGYQQNPFFFFTGASISVDTATGREVLNQRIERFIVHRAFAEASRPFNRFSRLEFGISANNVSHALLHFQTSFQSASGFGLERELEKTSLGGASYLQPSVALVHDNSVSLWTGPRFGRRSRFEYAPAVGTWRFHQLLGDHRRYDHLIGPFVLATRALFFGRFGRDDHQFPIFIGTPDLLRGYTSGSYRRFECANDVGTDVSDCSALDQLIGTRVGVFNAEIRFPLLGKILPGIAPLEGAVFFDAGMAWRAGSQIEFKRDPYDDPALVRAPLTSLGLSIRGNILGFMIFRGDYSKPLSRPGKSAFWTLSIGPTF